MTRVGAWMSVAAERLRAIRHPVRLIVALGLSSMLVAACDSTNTYPIDFFQEMHYEKSWHAQEPPRLDSPASAVQINQPTSNDLAYSSYFPLGNREPNYTADEAAKLKNPLEKNAANLALGEQLFTLNCVQCHGQKGLGVDTPQPAPGDGFMVIYFKTAQQQDPALIPPANLTGDKVRALSDGQIYYVLTHGLNLMPTFGNLLTPEQRWALVLHIRQLEGQ